MDLDHERRLTEVEARSKSNTNRLNDMEKRQDNFDELVGTVKVLATREEKVESDVKEIKSDVKILTGKPAKRWDSLVEKIILTAAGIIIGYILNQLGLGG